jgi:hypothetical protein
MLNTKDEESMKRGCKFAVVLGIGLALAPWALGQAPVQQPEASAAPAAVIPLDQQPTREQLSKLFEVMRVREQAQSVLKVMPALVQQQMQAQAKEIEAKHPERDLSKPEHQAAFNKVMNQFMEKAFNIITIDEMLDDMTAIYQRHISRADVDALIAFYSSPAGRHLLDAQPVIMQEYMPMVMKRVQERSTALTQGLVNDLEELDKSWAPAKGKPAHK